jgi:outer membrane lipopolysaccharide assembly protein LptE/RlpB
MNKPKFKKVVIDLTDNEFLVIAKKAHEEDITFNQMAGKIIEEEIKKLEKLKRN